jgi:Putative amidoligase enzyme
MNEGMAIRGGHGPHGPIAADGALRRVGVEIEFLGPSARVAAEVLSRRLGGCPEMEDPHAFKIRNTRLGDLSVESDLRYVHPQRHPGLGLLRPNARTAAWLGVIVARFVPRELITAPVPIAQLRDIDVIVAALRAAGARGRGAVLLDSLGLHFNVDPPRLDALTLTAFLKAFLLVGDRLREETARGSLRLRLALPPDYPPAYRRKVLAPDYWPNLAELTADYLAANPTRKRALDLLPVLAHFDEEKVRLALPREKIAARPVFHFRLPQAHLGDPNWSIMPDWNRWLSVERLALDLMGRKLSAGSELSNNTVSHRVPPPAACPFVAPGSELAKHGACGA